MADHLAPDLDHQRYTVITARTRRETLAKIEDLDPTVVVLDVASIRFDANRFCEIVQEQGLGVTILMLLPEGEPFDRTVGARAYLRYPFSTKKLVNRIHTLLPNPDDEVLTVGEISLNITQRFVLCNGRETRLTPKQASLLEVFMRHPGEILTRAFLMKEVWNTDYLGDTRTLDVHVHWVRKALEGCASTPKYIHTVHGLGYRMEVPQEESHS